MLAGAEGAMSAGVANRKLFTRGVSEAMRDDGCLLPVELGRPGEGGWRVSHR